MANGWLVFAVVACIIICAGFVLAVALLKQAWAHKEREELTSSDLRALEESALYLIEEIKSEADRAREELDSKLRILGDLTRAADEKIAALREMERSSSRRSSVVGREKSDPKIQEILDLASTGMDSREIARASGTDCAEVKLAVRLAEIRRHPPSREAMAD